MVIYFSNWIKTLERQVKTVPSVGQDNGQVLVAWLKIKLVICIQGKIILLDIIYFLCLLGDGLE